MARVMKVLIDGHMIGSNEGGNERYTKNLFLALSKLREKNFEVKLLVDKNKVDKTTITFKNNIILKYIINNIQRLLFLIPKIVSNKKIDIVHSNYICPFYKNAKFVVTVHDLSFKYFPQFFSIRERLIFKLLLPYSLNLSDAIIVPSEFTKKELLRFYPKYSKKVGVIYEGVDSIFRKISKDTASKIIRQRFKPKNDFLLTINSKNPKKNINKVIEAYLKLKDKFPNLELVIVGGSKNIKKQYVNSSSIRILSHVSDLELNALYNLAKIFIYFSIYEGFGLPLIEALKCRTKVIASDIDVHREIAKDYVVYANPFSAEDLTKKIELVLKSNRRTQKGISNLYSWEKAAKQSLNLYQELYKK